jgi:hypothetical protein
VAFLFTGRGALRGRGETLVGSGIYVFLPGGWQPEALEHSKKKSANREKK